MQRSLTLALFSSAVYAKQSVWGQCGGKNWSGATNCESGSTCSTLNPYYAQCVPGATTMVTTTPTSAAEDSPTKTSATETPTITSAPSGNPLAGYQAYVNGYYSSEVYNNAIPSMSSPLAAKASEVAEVPSFVWLDKISKVPSMGTYLQDIQEQNNNGASPPIAGIFVVYDLPDRDCAALASNGELHIGDDGVAKYKGYIDSIRELLVEYSDVQTILVIEPDSLANLVTNLDVQKCANAQDAYMECVAYAMKKLDLPNVAMYLDGGHAGWLGWPANLDPTAQLFGEVYKNAGSPGAVRGLATNVANYNAWTIDTCPSYTQGNPNCDEKKYVHALAPLLENNGYPAHFITDTSRNGVQPTEQNEWGDWCNVKGTGFGVRHTTDTGDSLEDAFVWVKPGGESDGTSDTSSPRYDAHCGYSDALKPAPEAGTWFEAYFEQLLKNANPAF